MDTSWLASYKVSDLPLPLPLVSLPHREATLFRAIDTLAEKHLLSLPVLTEGGQLEGIFDSLDVVAHVVQRAASGAECLEDLLLDSVMGCSRTTPEAKATSKLVVSIDTPLDEVAELVSGPGRRAVVMDAAGAAHSVVTQSVLLQFLHTKKEQIGHATLELTAEHLSSKSAVCVTEEQSALAAFQAIHEHGVSSVGIVDDQGVLISVVSATDLVVGLTMVGDSGKSSALRDLNVMTVLDFVARNRQLNLKARAATVTVAPQHSLEKVLEKLAACRVHRAMVCVDRKPVGVLSLTDLCRAVAHASD